VGPVIHPILRFLRLYKKLFLICIPINVEGRRVRKETERLCSDNEAGGRDSRPKRENLKN
jgi:hypothetical protein